MKMETPFASVTTSGVNPPKLAEERFPFTIRVVDNDDDLSKAVDIRHRAYARHLPDFAGKLLQPEAADYERDTVVLLAESKLDGSPLGSVRIQTNAYRSLTVEQSVDLPAWMDGRALAEVTRLGIEEGRIGRVVKIALVKACFQFCERQGIDYAIAAARSPLDQHYGQLMFEDVYPEAGFVPLQHAGNIPHRVMAFEIASGERRWTQAAHPLLKFFCYTRHPDIQVGGAGNLTRMQIKVAADPVAVAA